MRNLRIRPNLVLHLDAFDELRTAPFAQKLVRDGLEAIASAAGPGFVAQPSKTDRRRARGSVVPDTSEAARDSAANPAHLIGAMNAAR